jgi:hypothetical protein
MGLEQMNHVGIDNLLTKICSGKLRSGYCYIFISPGLLYLIFYNINYILISDIAL